MSAVELKNAIRDKVGVWLDNIEKEQHGDATAKVVDFDYIWKWAGYSRKDHAKNVLLRDYNQNIDWSTSRSPNTPTNSCKWRVPTAAISCARTSSSPKVLLVVLLRPNSNRNMVSLPKTSAPAVSWVRVRSVVLTCSKVYSRRCCVNTTTTWRRPWPISRMSSVICNGSRDILKTMCYQSRCGPETRGICWRRRHQQHYQHQ